MSEPDETTPDEATNQPPGPDRIAEVLEPAMEDSEPIQTMRAANQPLGPHDT